MTKTTAEYALARRMGFAVIVNERHKGAPHWNGYILQVSPVFQDFTIHELAHFLIAKKHNEQHLIDFGLNHKVFESFLGTETANKRELEAAWLEALLGQAIDAMVRECGTLWLETHE